MDYVSAKKLKWLDEITGTFTEDEYAKAVEFYKFLVSLSAQNKGILQIEWEKLIDLASSYMKVQPIEAFRIIKKMHAYGWIKMIDRHFIIVNLERVRES
ncbi:MAG: hypothetical protein OWQ50_00520 [Acidianus infernus]|nr:hypothetical protein [Acidianus infernus]